MAPRARARRAKGAARRDAAEHGIREAVRFLRRMVRTGLVAQPFDAGRLQLSGDPVRIAEPVGSFLDGAFFSASVNGVLVFRGPDEDRQLTWFDCRGNILGRAGEPSRYSGLTLDPSETRAVVVKQAEAGNGRSGFYGSWSYPS